MEASRLDTGGRGRRGALKLNSPPRPPSHYSFRVWVFFDVAWVFFCFGLSLHGISVGDASGSRHSFLVILFAHGTASPSLTAAALLGPP